MLHKGFRLRLRGHVVGAKGSRGPRFDLPPRHPLMFSTPRREERTKSPEGGTADGLGRPHHNGRRSGSLLTAERVCTGNRTQTPDLTPEMRPSKFGELPRKRTEKSRSGARPLLENSTACRKSMPNNLVVRSFGGSLDPEASHNEIPLVIKTKTSSKMLVLV